MAELAEIRDHSRSQQSEPHASILLVDDNPANLLSLRILLEDLTHNVVEAGSGEVALRHVEREEFAVILLDVLMPGLSGFDTARLMRTNEFSRHTPIIFLTAGDVDRSQLEEGYALGAVDFLVKPLVPVILRAKVRGFIELYQVKQRAKHESDQFRLLVQGTNEYAIFMLDPQGTILTWNSGAERLKGYSAEEIIGRHFSRFYPPDAIERKWPQQELEAARREGRFEDEGWRLRKDGSRFWANVVITALRDEMGNLRGFSKVTRDMTERKRSEENARRLVEETTARRMAEENARQIREQRERLRVTLSSIGDAVISTDAEGRVDFLNPIAQELVGWTAAEAANRHLSDVFRIINAETRRPVENPALKALKEGLVVGLEDYTLLIAKDGTELPIDDSAAPIRDADGTVVGSVLVFRDISERQQNEERLRASEARKTAILATALDCIITMDHAGNILEFNPAAEKTFGLRREQVLGKPLSEFIIPPAFRERHRQGLTHYLATGEGPVLGKRLELPALRADGTEFPVELSIVPISQVHPPSFTAYLRDISEQKRSEQYRLVRLAVTQALSEGSNAEEGAGGILEAVGENLGWDVGFVWTVNDRADALVCRKSWHRLAAPTSEFEATSCRRTFSRGEGLPGRVWATGKPAWILDVVSDTNFPRAAPAAREGLHSAIGCPIIVADQTIGVIEFFTHRMREPDANLLEIMATVAGSFGQFLERTSNENRRKDAERRFQAVFNQQFQFMVILAPDGTVVEANEMCFAATGVEREQVIGRLFWETPWWNHLPAMQAKWRQMIAQALAGAAPLTGEVQYLLRDGSVRLATTVVSGLKNHESRVANLIVEGRDITEQKQQEAALRESEEKLRLLANTIPQLAWMARPDGHVFWYNRRWYEYTGTNSAEMQGWGWQSVHDPEVLPAVLERWRRCIATGEPLDMVFPLRGADRKLRPFLTRALPLKDDQGRILYWFGTSTDISDIKRMEEALRDNDRRKDEFLATLAHELRNPLAPIRNSLQVLKMPQVDEEMVQETRDMMERQVHHLVRLVDDLLDVSRVMRGKIELRREPVELGTVIARAVETAKPLIESQGHKLEISLPRESLLLDADPVRLAQVIGNLLTNSAKYSEANGQIWLTAQRDGDEALLTVRDTGIGIAPDMLPHVFELFVQADHASTKAQGGLGVGLTLVKNLVEMHDGSVAAHSAGLGQGSQFVVRLPLMAHRSPERVDQSSRVEAPEIPKPGHRLLVVDDNRDAALSLSMLLRLQGHDVRVSHDGNSALAMAANFRPDMIFLDIGMPGMDGYEVARRIRKIPELEHVVLAALTGWGQLEDRRRTEAAGFDHHLVKPPEPKVIEGLLAELDSATK